MIITWLGHITWTHLQLSHSPNQFITTSTLPHKTRLPLLTHSLTHSILSCLSLKSITYISNTPTQSIMKKLQISKLDVQHHLEQLGYPSDALPDHIIQDFIKDLEHMYNNEYTHGDEGEDDTTDEEDSVHSTGSSEVDSIHSIHSGMCPDHWLGERGECSERSERVSYLIIHSSSNLHPSLIFHPSNHPPSIHPSNHWPSVIRHHPPHDSSFLRWTDRSSSSMAWPGSIRLQWVWLDWFDPYPAGFRVTHIQDTMSNKHVL